MRILNCSFFNIDETYIDAFRQMTDIVEPEALEDIRSRTYLPMIDDASPPNEVFARIKAAIEVANPEEGDVLIVSGTPDVIYYITSLVREQGVIVLCPLGKTRNGTYQLRGFREIVLDVSSKTDVESARFYRFD